MQTKGKPVCVAANKPFCVTRDKREKQTLVVVGHTSTHWQKIHQRLDSLRQGGEGEQGGGRAVLWQQNPLCCNYAPHLAECS